MKKKLLIIFSLVAFMFVVYVFTARHFIYKRIGSAGLKATDNGIGYYLDAEDKERDLIYTAIGDSLTSGVGTTNYEESYVYKFAEKISQNNTGITLYNKSYPGARTSDVIENLLSTAVNDQPDIVTLLIGVNDIHGNVSKKKFTQNYAEIIRRLKTETKARVLIINIPFIGTSGLLVPPLDFYYNYQTKSYNKIIKRLAQENDIEYIDIYSQTEDMFKDSDSCASDLFHPSAKGYELWAQIIYDAYHK